MNKQKKYNPLYIGLIVVILAAVGVMIWYNK